MFTLQAWVLGCRQDWSHSGSIRQGEIPQLSERMLAALLISTSFHGSRDAVVVVTVSSPRWPELVYFRWHLCPVSAVIAVFHVRSYFVQGPMKATVSYTTGIRREKMSADRNTSEAKGLLYSVYFKFVNSAPQKKSCRCDSLLEMFLLCLSKKQTIDHVFLLCRSARTTQWTLCPLRSVRSFA